MTTQGATINEPRINERIRVPEVRLVGPAGEQVGIVRIEDALRLAQEADLDLVEVAPNSRPPVAKLMDYGKFKYEAAVKAREARRNQANTEIKEMRFRLKIDEHDYETKKGHVIRFLKGGDKVKVTIMFRGREQSRPEMGRRLLQRLAEDVADLSIVENAPTQEGRNMSLVLGPLKKKAEARDEARKEREAKKAADAAERAALKAEKAATDAAAADAAPTEAPAEVVADEAPATAVVEETAPKPGAKKAAPKPAAKAAPKPVAKPAPKPAAKKAPAKKAPAKKAPAKTTAAEAPAAAETSGE
ncbi:translation initiation factor IF-3 [Demequina oxidasica]|uniref:translation initiation factor IF-3 n=1 Tax=Demequina oxidasica TaxID=676199 RepID=UPI0022A8D67C|nr:translation initiation factor IF-3 [Demequina oxidasica]